MQILIIDGHGGKLGRQLLQAIAQRWPEDELIAVGTNATATAAMLKGTSAQGATGENSVVVCCRTADIIVGPVGIAIADSLLGEVTPAMALAVGQSRAWKVLLPVNRCRNYIAGVSGVGVPALVADALEKIAAIRQNAGSACDT